MIVPNDDTQRVGLIGWPVEHSVSPAMFNTAFEALGMNWHYESFPTPPDRLHDTLRVLKTRDLVGFNVTVPHKRSVIPLLDELRPEAKTIGAVNTVIAGEDGCWRGTNTDIMGFHTDLLANLEPQASGRALVLGAGGAARAVTFVLARFGYQIHIACRNPSKGLEMIRDVQTGLTSTHAGAGVNT
ncbi:MAG: shikimate dehydrogenase, partial [Anaerolineae bacterium]|nr:shikimate dehydrogenase [Anaerolineae bacterium]